jgi:hypothetical protein
MLLIVTSTYYFRYVAPGTKYQGDPAHNLVVVNAFVDRMTREDVIYILSS